jgi:hypothetical protein
VGRFVGAVAVAALALALGTIAFRSRTERAPPVPSASGRPAERFFGHLTYTPEQSAALTEAGFAIFAGKRPTQTLSSASVAQVAEVAAMFERVACSEPACEELRPDVRRCLDEAGRHIGLRREKIESVGRKLFIAAMGVSVVTREVYYRTPAELAESCRRFVLAGAERTQQP